MKTEHRVYALLNQLADESGQIPTLREIRKKLGSGSFTTIAEAVRRWRTSKNSVSDVVEADSDEESLQALSDLLAQTLAPTLRALLQQETSQLKATVKALQLELEETKTQLRQEHEANIRLDIEREDLRDALDAERLARAKAEGALQALQKSLQKD